LSPICHSVVDTQPRSRQGQGKVKSEGGALLVANLPSQVRSRQVKSGQVSQAKSGRPSKVAAGPVKSSRVKSKGDGWCCDKSSQAMPCLRQIRSTMRQAVEADVAEPSQVKPSQAKSSQAKSSHALPATGARGRRYAVKPSQLKPSQLKSSQAVPATGSRGRRYAVGAARRLPARR
jgi:hypothetical protein